MKIADIKIESSVSSYEDSPFPPIVYKYRHWDNVKPLHKTILTKREVYFAAPNTFEDDMDSRCSVRFDLMTPGQIYTFLKNTLLRDYYGHSILQPFPFPEIEETVMELYRDHPLHNKEWAANYVTDDFKKFCNMTGILSVTEHCDLPEMWDEYGAAHTGICVGIDSGIAFKEFHGGGEVNYVDTYPIILPGPYHSYAAQFGSQLYMKEKKWSFEKEYRLSLRSLPDLQFNPGGRSRVLPLEAIKEVIIGANAPDSTIDQVTTLVTNNLPKTVIRRAKITLDTVVIN